MFHCIKFFLLELSEALAKERRVNEELRDALDNEYESLNKTDDRQLNVVKELQSSLTAVQVQFTYVNCS